MTFISLAQASRSLDVDPKTVRRWLAQAHVPVLSHPTDARLKGISESQLRELAQRHGRQLSRVSNQPPPPLAADTSTVPLALLDQLTQLHEQFTTLQQQLGLLTARLEHAPDARPARPKTSPRSPEVARAAKQPAKPAQVLARVEYAKEGQYVIICPTHGVLPFEPDSREWVGWLASQTAFRFVGQQGRLTAHREVDRLHPRPWRAHRKLRNRTHNLPLAHTADLTLAVLEHAAATLQAHLA